jgi:Tol biopolymer transport system component
MITPPNGDSRRASFSADGKKLVFQSRATNLTDQPTKDRTQIYMADLETGKLDLVSLTSQNEPSNGDAVFASLSADGSKLVFCSESSSLVPGDTNSFEDIYLRDLETGSIERVSVSSHGLQGNSASLRPSISHDASTLAFASRAKNLVPDDTSYRQDIFVRDLESKTTRRINLGPDGEEANGYSDNPQISGNGRFVVYNSMASNLVSGDTNGFQDIFLSDLKTGRTERVNVGPNHEQANGKTYEASVSDNGRYVAFYSYADNLVEHDNNDHLDVFVRDRLLETTERVSLDHRGQEIDGASYWAKISGDGTAVAFVSSAKGITEKEGYGYNDVFVRDRDLKTTTKVSVGSRGARSKASSTEPSLSSDGKNVAFTSWASNLVNESNRTRADVFLHSRDERTTRRVSQSL